MKLETEDYRHTRTLFEFKVKEEMHGWTEALTQLFCFSQVDGDTSKCWKVWGKLPWVSIPFLDVLSPEPEFHLNVLHSFMKM